MKTGNYERALPLNDFSEPSIFSRPFTAAWEVHRHRRDRDRDTEPFASGGLVRLDRYRLDSQLPEWLALLR